MNLTVIALDEPTPNFAAVFTKNAFVGAPITIGRHRLENSPGIGAVLVNNKISNVCAAGDGIADAEQLCAALADRLSLPDGAQNVLPSSTGVIGWSLPVNEMKRALPDAIDALQPVSMLPAAEGIMTTDLYPKVRSASVGSAGGRIVGIAKGAGMIEPDLATMLAFVTTDIAVPRERLREMLPRVVGPTFNSISIDSDQSTSDMVVVLSSGRVPLDATQSNDAATEEMALKEFEAALAEVCGRLAEDIVRNGEGVGHVVRVAVSEAPNHEIARGVGKAVVNSPLTKCAVAGNDPNVGRIAGAVGDYLGRMLSGSSGDFDFSRCKFSIGGVRVFRGGKFELDGKKEEILRAYMAKTQIRRFDGCDSSDVVGSDFPPHEACVEISIDLGMGDHSAVVLGADLTHGYVTENADYRS
jgi:glutamate N-acetyltransferase/amino-acid N-acetyltransferase